MDRIRRYLWGITVISLAFVATVRAQWYEGGSRVNILLPPIVWTCYTDELGTVVEPRGQVVHDGIMSLRYDVARKQGEVWSWLQLEAELPYSLADVDSLTVSYSSDHPIALILPQQAFVDEGSFAHYRYVLPPAAAGNTLTIEMDAFVLPDWAPQGSRAIAFDPKELRKVALSPALTEEGGRGSLRVDQIILSRRGAEATLPKAFAESPPAEPVIAVPAATAAPNPLPETQTLFFRTNSTEIENEYLPMLREVQTKLEADSGLRLEILGFADSLGDPMYNMAISEQRAQVVAGYLSGRGVPGERMKVGGRGSEEPPAFKEEGIAVRRERRVEIRYLRAD